MDRFSFISAGLFSFAGLCAMISLSTSEWIVDVGNNSRYGLMWSCFTLVNRKQVCFKPILSTEWLITLILIILGIICITTVVTLLLASKWDRNVIFYARWVGFVAMIVFCLAAVVFPLGFYIEEINGLPFQLPSSHQVGISYIFFILALWITVISELFAGKICLPHF